MQSDMTTGNPFPIILKFMLPLFIGNVFQQLYNMTDTIIVGRFVGANALAAVGSTGTIMFLVLGFSQGLTTGFTVLTSQRFGAGKMEKMRRSVGNGISLSIIVIAVMTVLSVSLMDTILKMMNTPSDIYNDAYTYITIICMGIAANVFYNLFAAFLRAVGNSRGPLYFLIFSACLNVVLDIVCIVIFHLGVAGAAIATVTAQGISAILCLFYMKRYTPILIPSLKHFRINMNDTRHQLSVGLPMALQFGITASGTMIMQSAINLFGSTAVAAYTAANKLSCVVTQEMPAMGQAMATYAGQNYGKGDYRRIRAGVRSALIIDTVYALLAAVIILIGLRPVLGLFFASDAAVSEAILWAKPYAVLAAVFYIPLSYIFVFRNVMQGCSHGILPMMGGVVELGARLLCAAISVRIMSYTLAVACDPAAWLSAAVFTGVSYLFVMKSVRQELGNDV